MKGSGHISNREGAADHSDSTSTALLEQVKEGNQEKWNRLVDLYRPLVLSWCKDRVPPHDHEDVVQEVFKTVFQKVKMFAKAEHCGGFRAWLREITRNKIRECWKRAARERAKSGGSAVQEMLVAFPDKAGGDSACENDASERRILLHSAMKLVRPEFQPSTWEAALRTAMHEERAADVAAALGMTTRAVYIAKSRVLKRLRQEMGDLLE
jgi:RNA polymerase sigma-70 factor (ECF subfamily)